MVEKGIVKTSTFRGTTQASKASRNAPGYGLFTYGSDHVAGASALKTGQNWIALCDAPNAEIDLFAEYTLSGTAAIDLGTVHSYQPVAGNNVYDQATGTITNASAAFITNGLKVGDALQISGSSSNNDGGFVIDTLTETVITIHDISKFALTDETESGQASVFTSMTKAIYHFADEALRTADASFSPTTKPKWYGYVDRQHFSGLDPGGASANTYDNWFENDNDLLAPSIGIVGSALGGDPAASDIADDIATSDTNTLATNSANFPATLTGLADHNAVKRTALTGSSETVGITAHISATNLLTDVLSGGGVWDFESYAIYPTAGNGFNLDIAATAEGGTWVAGTYEFASTFIYDGNQESLPFTMTDTFTVSANDSLKIFVFATAPFNERISGGRIYYRDSTIEGEWQFLIDISLKDGARPDIFGDYTAWGEEYTNAVNVYTSVTVKNQALDTYETLNGFQSDVASINIGQLGDGYATSIVANNRTFVANISVTDEDGNSNARLRDRIMYTPAGRYDTFPTTFFIDVVKGDAGEYVKLEEFNGRLLAFKQDTLFIININAPNPANWFLEQRMPFYGVDKPAQTFRTAFGVAWYNEHGAYIYDGGKIANLLGEKIDRPTWKSFYTKFGAVFYLPNNQYLVFADDITSVISTANQYVFSLVSNSWTTWQTTTESLKIGRHIYTNFITDWNSDAAGGAQATAGAASVDLETYEEGTVFIGGSTFDIRTKDLDFGHPGQLKKIYKVIVTYKSDAAQSGPVAGAINGSTSSWSNFTGTIIDTSGAWDVGTFTANPAFTCQSLRMRILNNTGNADISINDITIVYRLLPFTRVT